MLRLNVEEKHSPVGDFLYVYQEAVLILVYADIGICRLELVCPLGHQEASPSSAPGFLEPFQGLQSWPLASASLTMSSPSSFPTYLLMLLKSSWYTGISITLFSENKEATLGTTTIRISLHLTIIFKGTIHTK